MNSLDIIIILLITSLALLGYLQGFIVGFASLFGLLLGGVVGIRGARFILENTANTEAANTWAPLLGLLVALIVIIAGAISMQDLGTALRARIKVSEDQLALDHALGAILLAIVGLLLTWFAASAAMGTPQLRQARPIILNSRLVAVLNSAMPNPEPLIGTLSSYDPFPKFEGGTIDAAPPDESLPSDPLVERAARSVVRVVGNACGYRITGSGWVAARGFVITNAHVVAGQTETAIQTRGGTDKVRATVVWFDSNNDIAVLRLRTLSLNPLPFTTHAKDGTPSVVIGFPENHGLTTVAARIDREKTVRAHDIYGNGPVERKIVSFRGTVRHGNSGGPVVNSKGEVITTVFATTVGKKINGGYGVPNTIMRNALQKAQQVPNNQAARTGPCID